MRKSYLTFHFNNLPASKATAAQFKELAALRKARAALPGKGAAFGTPTRNVQEYLNTSIHNARTAIPKHNVHGHLSVEYFRRGLYAEASGYRYEAKSIVQRVREHVKQVRASRRHVNKTAGRYIGNGLGYSQVIGKVHDAPGFWLGIAKSKKAVRVRQPKVPIGDGAHVGLELEFCSPLGQADISALLLDAGLESYVQLKGDGSVRPESVEHTAHEICILTRQDEVSSVVPRVTAVLKAAKAYVNASCGFHVHLDMRNREVSKSWGNLRACQSLLYKMVPKTRKDNTYCKPVRTKSVERARRSGNRYVGINAQALRSHRTLEVRLHSSTLDPLKIIRWVDLLVRIVDAQPMTKAVRSVKALRTEANIPLSLAAYMKARIKLFAAQHAGEQGAEVEAA